jgi:hypothetical protein
MLGSTRTCDLLIRSHSPSGTQADTEGQGETKQRFYQVLALLERQGGTGRDTQLRSDCGQTRPDLSDPAAHCLVHLVRTKDLIPTGR